MTKKEYAKFIKSKDDVIKTSRFTLRRATKNCIGWDIDQVYVDVANTTPTITFHIESRTYDGFLQELSEKYTLIMTKRIEEIAENVVKGNLGIKY